MSVLDKGIHYRIGDVLKAMETKEVDMVAHGVNCRGGFGSGIAGQITSRYPLVRSKYMGKHFGPEGWKLGDVQIVLLDDSNNGRIIANCATQDTFGIGVHADYQAIHRVMVALHHFSSTRGIKLGIPLIGAGLAGGDWATITKIIEGVFIEDPIYVYILEGEMNPPESLPREILDQLGKNRFNLESLRMAA